jgi:hypothetical protein
MEAELGKELHLTMNVFPRNTKKFDAEQKKPTNVRSIRKMKAM